MIFLFALPETLEQADPIPCIARAMNRRPKLLLNANAKKKDKLFFLSSKSLKFIFTKS